MVCPGDQSYIKFSPLLSFKIIGQNKICDIKYFSKTRRKRKKKTKKRVHKSKLHGKFTYVIILMDHLKWLIATR